MSGWMALSAPRLGSMTRLTRGRFIGRPHRFAARVALAGGEVVEAHLANPGRLTGVLSVGGEVVLEGPFPPPRALPYTCLAARVGGIWAGIVTTYANRIFPVLLAAGVFPELHPKVRPGLTFDPADPKVRPGVTFDLAAGVFPELHPKVRPGLTFDPADPKVRPGVTFRREVVHGRSRFDFEVGDRLVEVKSVSMADGPAGLFPDAVTARGARHCDELAALARRRRETAIVFVAQRGDIESVAPAEEVDPRFARSLRAASRAGVLVLACALRMTPRGATAVRRVPVLL